MHKLEIKMLGDFDIVYDGISILYKLSNKAAGILCYLALNEGKLISREKLSQLFWDNSNMESARYNLRYTLWHIKKSLKKELNDFNIIENKKNCCKLNENLVVSSDVMTMNQICEDIKKNGPQINNLEQIRQLYRGDFFEGFEVKNCFELNDWIFYEKENLQRKYFDALKLLAHEYRCKQNYHKCIEIFEQMLRINPLLEELYVELIKIYLAIGDRNAAITQYERCCDVLREELNIAPMESTKKILEEIKKCDNPQLIIENKESGQGFLRQSSKIIYTYDIIRFEETFLDKGNSKKFFTACFPPGTLNYYWLWELFDTIINNYNDDELKYIPQHYWSDISAVHGGAFQLINQDISRQSLTDTTEKTRIFTSALTIIKTISKGSKWSVFIRDFQFIDDISFEFFLFLMFKKHQLNIDFILQLTKECEKFSLLTQHFEMIKL